MKHYLKMGLSLLLFVFYGALSNAANKEGVSPPTPLIPDGVNPPAPLIPEGINPPHIGSYTPGFSDHGTCKMKPKTRMEIFVCSKGDQKWRYEIYRQALKMSYNTDRRSVSIDSSGSGGTSCTTTGLHIDFCELHKGKSVASKTNIQYPTSVIFSDYDKWERTVCWTAQKQAIDRAKPPKGNACKRKLQSELDMNRKKGWKCKLAAFPPVPVPASPDQESSDRGGRGNR